MRDQWKPDTREQALVKLDVLAVLVAVVMAVFFAISLSSGEAEALPLQALIFMGCVLWLRRDRSGA